jgi:FkbM family methyltransferase
MEATQAHSGFWVVVEAGQLRGRRLKLPRKPPQLTEEAAAGRYESFLHDAMEDAGGGTVWDVGGFVGYHSLAFARIVGPSGQVVVVEPSPPNLDWIRENLDANPDLAERIRLVEAGLAERDGASSLVTAGAADACAYLEDTQPPLPMSWYSDEGYARTPVRIARLDTLVDEDGLPPPSILKIDVEGAEHVVLAGARRTLRRHRPVVLVELHGDTAGARRAERLLRRFGYELQLLHEEKLPPRRFVIARPPGGSE